MRLYPPPIISSNSRTLYKKMKRFGIE